MKTWTLKELPSVLIRKMLDEAREHSNGTITQLSINLDIRYCTVSSWYRGSWPNEDNLKKLEKFMMGVKK